METKRLDDQRAAIYSKISQLPKVLGSINEIKIELRRSKIMIVGECCAGKTAFANSIIGKKYEETESTVGINTFLRSVTHAALSKSEWKKCEKIEKEYENAIAEHLSSMKFVDIEDDDLTQQESDSSTDSIDQSSNDKVDKDMIVKYLANHVEIGANILTSIFDYGGQTVFNVSTMFMCITIVLFADNSVNHNTFF